MKRFFLFTILIFAGCTHAYVFKEAAPVKKIEDQKLASIPQKTNDFDFVEYTITSSIRYPAVDLMDTRRSPRSKDVNSLDQLPASSWYTPRLGYRDLSPEELLRGPEKVGPPKAPLTIIKAKTKGNSPGFLIKDSRGEKYLLKFDPSDYPNLESTVNLVASRLFWGFGYNTPEDYLVAFTPEDLKDDPASGVKQEDIDNVLTLSASPDDKGQYHATASLFLPGKILGPVLQRGTRKGDLNDKIPHQDLRILRAMRMFSAWTDQSGFRIDNSMDVYEGPEGQGHTVHYLLDFGEAMGAHGVEKDRVWDGFEYLFSIPDSTRKYLTLGIPVQRWENLKVAPSDPRGSFEAEAFDPAQWRATTQFMAIQKSQPDDDYWAAKIIAAVTREHLEKLFAATEHPDQDYVKDMIEILWKRREKVLNYAFSRVTPLESLGIKNGSLKLEDIRQKFLGAGVSRYEVRYFNKGRKQVAKKTVIEGKNGLELPVGDLLKAANGYLRVEIRAVENGQNSKKSRAAQFHVRETASGPVVAGVVH